jgi:hypothetical protein
VSVSAADLRSALAWLRSARRGHRGDIYVAGAMTGYLESPDPLEGDRSGRVCLGGARRNLHDLVRSSVVLTAEEKDLVARYFGLIGYPWSITRNRGDEVGVAGVLSGAISDSRSLQTRAVSERAVRMNIDRCIDLIAREARPSYGSGRDAAAYVARPPTELGWFVKRQRRPYGPNRMMQGALLSRAASARLVRAALLACIDDDDAAPRELVHAVVWMLSSTPSWIGRAGLTVEWRRLQGPLPRLTGASTTRPNRLWNARAYAAAAIALWDLTHVPVGTNRRTREGTHVPVQLQALSTAPAELARLFVRPDAGSVFEALRALETLKGPRDWTAEVAMLVLNHVDRLIERGDLPPEMNRRALQVAIMANAESGRWIAVPLARRMLRDWPGTAAGFDIPLRAVPLTNNAGAHPVAWRLLDQIERLIYDERATRTVAPFVVAETRQQVHLLRAGTLRAALQGSLESLVRAPSAFEPTARRSADLARAALSDLTTLGAGWESGTHGGSASLAWTITPQVTLAELALVADAVAARLPVRERPNVGLAFDQQVAEARVLVAQAGGEAGTATYLRSELRLLRLEALQGIARRDADQYQKVAARLAALVGEATKDADGPPPGMSLDRLHDLDALARQVLGVSVNMVPDASELSSRPRSAAGLGRIAALAQGLR